MPAADHFLVDHPIAGLFERLGRRMSLGGHSRRPGGSRCQTLPTAASDDRRTGMGNSSSTDGIPEDICLTWQ